MPRRHAVASEGREKCAHMGYTESLRSTLIPISRRKRRKTIGMGEIRSGVGSGSDTRGVQRRFISNEGTSRHGELWSKASILTCTTARSIPRHPARLEAVVFCSSFLYSSMRGVTRSRLAESSRIIFGKPYRCHPHRSSTASQWGSRGQWRRRGRIPVHSTNRRRRWGSEVEQQS